MKIVLVHNFYQQPGGEDVIFEQERRLLESNGHQVVVYNRSNFETESWNKLQLLKNIVWANDSKADIERLLKAEKPDVVHIHNTFMVISPSIYQACVEAGVPTVQTLHNYRLLCPTATFYRDGHVCEDCLKQNLFQSVKHACYRNSRANTAAVAFMLAFHRQRGTWAKDVTRFIALTEFARERFIESGLPSRKIVVKPNFIDPDPGERAEAGGYAFFAGRLTPEKGVGVLLDAWKLLKNPIPLKIAGDGPARADLEAQAERLGLKNVEFLGRIDRSDVVRTLKGAHFVVVPSLWYEGFAVVLVDGFACGLPVLTSRIGSMIELVEDGKTGLLFNPGDAKDLAARAQWLWDNPEQAAAIGRNARQEYLQKYTAEQNYAALMDIYKQAIEESRGIPLSPAELIADPQLHDV